MTRFFFHFRQAEKLQIDDEGLVFPDLPAALKDATRAARDMMVEAARDGRDLSPSAFHISDLNGPVATLFFAEVVMEDPADRDMGEGNGRMFWNRH